MLGVAPILTPTYILEMVRSILNMLTEHIKDNFKKNIKEKKSSILAGKIKTKQKPTVNTLFHTLGTPIRI